MTPNSHPELPTASDLMKFAGLPAVTHRSWHQFRLIPTLDEIHYTVKGALFAKAEARSVGVMLGHREVCWFCLS